MKHTIKVIGALALSVAPIAAFAQDISGGATLGYGFSDISDIEQDLDSLTFDGRVTVAVGNGVSFGADLSAARVDIDDVPDTINGSVIGAHAAYGFANGVSVGVYAEEAKISSDILSSGGIGIDPSITSYGMMASYKFANGEVGGFFGRSETNPSIDLIDVRDFGLSGTYAPMENLTLAGAFIRTTVENPIEDVDADFIGLAAAYDLNDTWTLFGGYANTSAEFAGIDGDIDTFGIGASYDLTSMMTVKSYVSLELARTDLSINGSGADLDTVRLGLSFPFGAEGSNVPMNSVADAIMNPRHSTVSQTILTAF